MFKFCNYSTNNYTTKHENTQCRGALAHLDYNTYFQVTRRTCNECVTKYHRN